MSTINLFLAFDGTNNHKDNDRIPVNGVLDDSRTSVAKLFDLADANTNTIALYEKGVGTRDLTDAQIDLVEAGSNEPGDFYSNIEKATALGLPFDSDSQSFSDQINGMLGQVVLKLENAIDAGDSVVIDGLGYSRGGVAFLAFINEVQTLYPNQFASGQFSFRNVVLFDPVGSVFLNDGVNVGFNININENSADNIIVYRANNIDEPRRFFGGRTLQDQNGNTPSNVTILDNLRGNHGNIGGGRSNADNNEKIIHSYGPIPFGSDIEAEKATLEQTAAQQGFTVEYIESNKTNDTMQQALNRDYTHVTYYFVEDREVIDGLDNVYLNDAYRRFTENGTNLNPVSELGTDSEVPSALQGYSNDLANGNDTSHHNGLLDDFVSTSVVGGVGGKFSDDPPDFISNSKDSDNIRDTFYNDPSKAVDPANPSTFQNDDSLLDTIKTPIQNLLDASASARNNVSDFTQSGGLIAQGLRNYAGILRDQASRTDLTPDEVNAIHDVINEIKNAQENMRDYAKNNSDTFDENYFTNLYGQTLSAQMIADAGLGYLPSPIADSDFTGATTQPKNPYILNVNVAPDNLDLVNDLVIGNDGLVLSSPGVTATMSPEFVNERGWHNTFGSVGLADNNRPGNKNLAETLGLVNKTRDIGYNNGGLVLGFSDNVTSNDIAFTETNIDIFSVNRSRIHIDTPDGEINISLHFNSNGEFIALTPNEHATVSYFDPVTGEKLGEVSFFPGITIGRDGYDFLDGELTTEQILNQISEAFSDAKNDSDSDSDTDPFVFNFGEGGINFSNVTEFDLDGDDDVESALWPDASTSILVWDKNRDGLISNGSEFIGVSAHDSAINLKDLDTDGDGFFTMNDDSFHEIEVWIDVNQDFFASEYERESLSDAGIVFVNLNEVIGDIAGQSNVTGLEVTLSDNRVETIWDVDLESKDQRQVDISVYAGGILKTIIDDKISLEAHLDVDTEISIDDSGAEIAIGNAGDDTLNGSEANEWLIGRAGSDSFNAYGGRDLLVIDADDKMDMIDAGNGIDTIIIADHRAMFLNLSETNSEIVFGGYGDDTFVGGGADNYFINGAAGNDLIIGGSVDDVLNGEDGDDVIDGGAGDDVIRGHRGKDVLFGGANNDYMDGGLDNDYLDGGDGDDVFVASNGDDVIYGGGGINLIQLSGELQDYRFEKNADGSIIITDLIENRDGTETLFDVQKFSFVSGAGSIVAHFGEDYPVPVHDVIDNEVVQSDGSILFSVDKLTANDLDFQNDIIKVRSVGDAVGGTVELINNKTQIRFIPDKTYTGTLRFNYLIEDVDGTHAPEVELINNPGESAEVKGEVILKIASNLPTDPDYTEQWYLDDTRVSPVWRDYTGTGINILIFEPSNKFGNEPQYVDFTNADLAPNKIDSFDINGKATSSHATLVAGVIGAARNGVGSVGVAYNAILDSRVTSWNSVDGIPMEYYTAQFDSMKDYDVVNNSWGYSADLYHTVTEIQKEIIQNSIDDAVTRGRDGKGTVLVYSAGNDRKLGADSSISILHNSFTITVGGINQVADIATGDFPVEAFSSPGSSILISAPSSGITSTGTHYQNSNGSVFGADSETTQGTSFAAPIVSGVVALMLEANPDLTYRDVQEILALTATQVDDGSTWSVNAASNLNGAGMHFNRDFGFGQVDALAAIRLAETWDNLSPQDTSSDSYVPSSTPDNLVDNGTYQNTLAINENLIVETVEVEIDLTHTRWSDLKITLVSHSGTKSVLLDRYGYYNGQIEIPTASSQLQTKITSTHFRGEESFGDWKLEIYDYESGETGTINNWKLNIYGRNLSADDNYFITNEYSDYPAIEISDTEGFDTLNASVLSEDLVLDLSLVSNSFINTTPISISAGSQIEKIISGDGDDSITGDSNANYINTGRGDDSIDGGAGDDVLRLGEGSGDVIGGTGRDNYIIEADTVGDIVIHDYSPSEREKIVFVGAEISSYSQLSLSQDVNDTLIDFNSGQGQIRLIDINSSDLDGSHFRFYENDSSISDGNSIDIGKSLHVETERHVEPIYTWQSEWIEAWSGGPWYLRAGYVQSGTEVSYSYKMGVGTSDDDIITNGNDYHNKPDHLTTSEWESIIASYNIPENYRYLSAYDGDDEIYGDDRKEWINAGIGFDYVEAAGGDDKIVGESGNDILYGGDGHDEIYGWLDNASLYSSNDYHSTSYRNSIGDDNDELTGGLGNDLLNGGIGSDMYYYQMGHGNDVIIDDRVDMNELTINGVNHDDVTYSLSLTFNHSLEDVRLSGIRERLVDLSLQLDFSNSLEYLTIEQIYAESNLNPHDYLPINSIIYEDQTILVNDQLSLLYSTQFGSVSNQDDIVISDYLSAGDIYLDDGDDIIYGKSAIDIIYGGNGDDLIYGRGSMDQLYGGDDNDVIFQSGFSDNSLLSGNAGDDYLYGSDGGDILDGGVGDDTISSGLGNDVIVYTSGNDVVADLLSVDDTIRFDGIAKNDVTVSSLIVDLESAVTLTINSSLSDTLSVENFDADATLEFSDETITLGEFLSEDLFVKTQPTDIVIDQADVLSFTNLDSYFTHSLGDVLEYTVSGSAGSEIPGWLNYNKSLGLISGVPQVTDSGAYTIDIKATDQNGFYAITSLGITVNNTSNLVNTPDSSGIYQGTIGDDYINAGPSSSNILYGYGGHDYLEGLGEVNELYGGAGNDIYNIYETFSDDIIFNIHELHDEGIDEVRINTTTDPNNPAYPYDYETGYYLDYIIPVNVENLRLAIIHDSSDGSTIKQFATGNELDNVIYAGSDSYIVSGDGNDTIIDDIGRDYLDGQNGSDKYVFDARLSGKNQLVVHEEIDELDVVEIHGVDFSDVSLALGNWEDAYDSDLRDWDIFSTSNDKSGLSISYDDFLIGIDAAWNSNLFEINFINSEFDRTVITQSDIHERFMLGTANDDVLISVNGDDDLEGLSGNDILHGRDGNDSLYGGAGDDYLYGDYTTENIISHDELYGGEGNDYLFGGKGDDLYHFFRGDGIDVIEQNSSHSWDGGIDHLKFNDISLSELQFESGYRDGNLYDLVVRINDEDDKVTVKDYFKHHMDDSHIAAQLEYIDVFNSNTNSYDTLEYLDVINLVNTHSPDNEDDVMLGTNDVNTLHGADGDDIIFTLAGNDNLRGGAGVDVLHGGAGDDTYIFHVGDGIDTIQEEKDFISQNHTENDRILVDVDRYSLIFEQTGSYEYQLKFSNNSEDALIFNAGNNFFTSTNVEKIETVNGEILLTTQLSGFISEMNNFLTNNSTSWDAASDSSSAAYSDYTAEVDRLWGISS